MPKDIVVGINIHHKGFMAYTDNLEQNLDDCAAMGLKMIRYNNNGNTPEALAEIKHVADECHKRGMKIMLCMDHYKSWSHRGERTFEEHEAYFEEYMEKVSAYLKDDIDIYQVFNEMDVSCMGGDIFNITKPGRDGLEKGEYDSVMWDNGIVAMRGSLKGLKKGYDKAVTSVNFCYELLDESIYEKNAGRYHGESHFGFIECDDFGGNRVFKPVWKTCADKIKELGI